MNPSTRTPPPYARMFINGYISNVPPPSLSWLSSSHPCEYTEKEFGENDVFTRGLYADRTSIHATPEPYARRDSRSPMEHPICPDPIISQNGKAVYNSKAAITEPMAASDSPTHSTKQTSFHSNTQGSTKTLTLIKLCDPPTKKISSTLPFMVSGELSSPEGNEDTLNPLKNCQELFKKETHGCSPTGSSIEGPSQNQTAMLPTFEGKKQISLSTSPALRESSGNCREPEAEPIRVEGCNSEQKVNQNIFLKNLKEWTRTPEENGVEKNGNCSGPKSGQKSSNSSHLCHIAKHSFSISVETDTEVGGSLLEYLEIGNNSSIVCSEGVLQQREDECPVKNQGTGQGIISRFFSTLVCCFGHNGSTKDEMDGVLETEKPNNNGFTKEEGKPVNETKPKSWKNFCARFINRQENAHMKNDDTETPFMGAVRSQDAAVSKWFPPVLLAPGPRNPYLDSSDSFQGTSSLVEFEM